MAYDPDLVERLREVLAAEPDVEEKRMFGGLAFLLSGHMTAAASRDGGMMLRVEPARADELLEHDGVTRMVMRGREMGNWLRVADRVLVTDDDALRAWVAQGVGYVRSLPPKH